MLDVGGSGVECELRALASVGGFDDSVSVLRWPRQEYDSHAKGHI